MVLAGVAFATPALAHATLIATDPADGALVATAPERIVLTFNEPVGPTVMRLIAPDGTQRDVMSATRTEGPAVVVTTPDIGDGTHLLSWRAVSEDGHPIGGTLTFSVGEFSGTAVVVAESADVPLDTAIWLVRLLLYLALFIGVAGAFFAAWLAPGRPAPAAGAMQGLLVLGLVAVPAAFALQGADLLGTGLAGALDPAAWRAAADSTYAATLLVMILACVAGLASLHLPPLARMLSLLGFVAIGGALALSGHASRAPVSLAWAAVFLHTVAVAFWTGALAPLLVVLRRSDETATAVLARFSAAIPVAIGGLLTGGILLVLVQVEAPSDLWTTAYGRVLAAKLAAVAVLFALAAINRFALTPVVRTNGVNGAFALRRSIVVELVLVGVVLALVAGWRFTPPPRSLASAPEVHAAVTVELSSPNTNAIVTVTPGAPGAVSASIALSGANGAAIVPAEVAISFANPAAGIEPIRQPAVPGDDGTWQAGGFFLPVAGEWEVAVDARVSAFDARTIVGRFILGGAGAEPAVAGPAVSPPVTVGTITVSQAWTRKNPPGAPTGVAYMTITNAGPDEERLLSVSSPLAGEATLHETAYQGNVATMTAQAAIVIPPGATVILGPNGTHVMFSVLAPDFATGEIVPATLVFAGAGKAEVSLAVFPAGSLGPGGSAGR
jgi:copper transport protein